jgi:tetratricopeptide (TPR) repeat protein
VDTASAATKQQGLQQPPQPRRPGARTFQDRVRELNEQAEDLAARGKEDDALSVYKKSLKVNRIETSRIKTQLKQVDGKHPSTVQSIASRLYEDWLQVGTNIAEVRCQMAVLSERVGDYDRALACCSEARGVYKRQLAFLERKKIDTAAVKARAKTLSKLGDKLSRAKDSFGMRKHLHEEIIVLRRALQAEHGDSRQLYARLEEMSQRALALETDSLGREHPQVADTLSVLASIAIEQGRICRAERFLKEAIVIAQNSLGSQHPLTGEVILQMARIKASQPKVDEETALQYYEDALANFRLVNPSLVTPALNEMAVIRIRQRQYPVAIDLLNQAIDSSEPHDSLVQVYRNLGECYSHMRDYTKAADAFVRALDKQREGRRQCDATTDDTGPSSMPLVDDESIADTVRRLGKAYMGCGRHSDALNMYGEALLIHRASVLKAVNPIGGKPNEGLPDRQDQLAHTLFCIAEARETIGDLSEAERVYAESMQLRLFSDAHRAEKRQNMIHCAMCLRGIGLVHMSRKEYESAQRVFDDALRYCEGHGTCDNPVSPGATLSLTLTQSNTKRSVR